MKNKKVMIAIISVVALLLLLIGITYAYWLLTKTQTNSNIISSACLDITLDNETNDINLTSQYPMSDEDGMKLIPYTFTVTNNCNTSVDYQIALESLGDEATSIKSSAIKVALDDNIRILSDGGSMETTISGAYESNRLGVGTLAARGSEGSSVTHSLRIWIDENAPISEANKTFKSKISVTIGQGIANPYKEGTMAYDILANNDDTEIVELDVTKKEFKRQRITQVSAGTSSRTFGTSYTYDESTRKFALSGDIVEATTEECRNGTKNCGKYFMFNQAQIYEIIDINYRQNTILVYELKYIQPFFGHGIEPSLNKTQDDLGTSYYYRGAVANNYVQFGTYSEEYVSYTLSDESACWGTDCTYITLEECESYADYDYDSSASCVEIVSSDAGKDMYWRIVRINGDGTIRLVYDGTTKSENGTTHSAIIGNSPYNRESNLDVNYNDSYIKNFIDTWYNTHLKTDYESYIADGIFCNDKEAEEEYYDEDGEKTTADNAYFTTYSYVSRNRLETTKIPKLTCTRKEDRYTMSTNLGNGLLDNSVGLLSADEVLFAGGVTYGGENHSYYLANGSDFFVNTPYSYDPDIEASVWSVNNDGNVTEYSLVNDYGVRPVINLRADVEFTGDGSFETPYVIKTN